MNRILHAVLAVALLGSSSALAQTDAQSPTHRELPDQAPAATGAASDLAAGGAERTSKLRDDAAPRRHDTAATDHARGRLSDPQSGCAAFEIDTIPADAVAWSGKCTGGLANGPGTMMFSRQGKFVESLSGDFDQGVLLNGYAKVKFANGSFYEGDAVAAGMEGTGMLTTAEGDRLQGQWSKNSLNGRGVATWVNGDRYDGDWRDGRADGQGIQIWANGRKYDGQWQNDVPNGHGVVTRKDGSRYQATFAGGHPSDVTEIAAEAPSAPAAAAAAKAPATGAANTAETSQDAAEDGSHSSSIDRLAGKKFSAIDGSTFALTPTEGGLTREIVAPDGAVKRTVFEFLTDTLGSVHEGDDGGAVVGVFRVTATGVTADYADGRSETLILNRAGGVSLMRKAPTGAATCMAWYPDGHSFSTPERKAAVTEYARRIGLPESRGSKVDAAAKHSCDSATEEIAPAPRPRAPKLHARTRAGAVAPAAKEASRIASYALDSDAPVTMPAAPVDLVQSEMLPTAGTSEPRAISPHSTASNEPQSVAPGTNEASASACLKVESDGRHWGFRNHCAFDVQFSYCLMNASDRLTSCSGAPVAGSVAASGFGSLIADQGLHDSDADHDFRWVACGGGAGEVVAHLERSDPPAGRCVRPDAS